MEAASPTSAFEEVRPLRSDNAVEQVIVDVDADAPSTSAPSTSGVNRDPEPSEDNVIDFALLSRSRHTWGSVQAYAKPDEAHASKSTSENYDFAKSQPFSGLKSAAIICPFDPNSNSPPKNNILQYRNDCTPPAAARRVRDVPAGGATGGVTISDGLENVEKSDRNLDDFNPEAKTATNEGTSLHDSGVDGASRDCGGIGGASAAPTLSVKRRDILSDSDFSNICSGYFDINFL